MLVSDVLVTDYSSAIYEFALLGRPMAFFAPDYEAYEAERGFYFDYRTGVPGPIFETSEALARYLRAGDFDIERVDRFREASFDVADGRSAARVTDELIVPALAAAKKRRVGVRARLFEGSVYHTAALHPRPQCRPCDRN